MWCFPQYRNRVDKKAAKLPALNETLIVPETNDPEASVLELDERMARLC
jgi:hypothetical protein